MAVDAAMRRLQGLSQGQPAPDNSPVSLPEGAPDESAQGVPSWDQIKAMREEARAQRGLQPGQEVEQDVPEDEQDLAFKQFAEEFTAGGLGEESQSNLAAERSQMPDFLPPGMKQLMQKYSVMNAVAGPPMPPQQGNGPGPGGGM